MQALGIDLGGTQARAAVVDERGVLVSSAKTLLVDRSPAAVVGAIAEAAQDALAMPGVGRVERCGVGVAAQLRSATGEVLVAPNLGWRDVPFGALLAERLGRPVCVINDLKAAAFGELRVGAGRGASEVFVVFVGSGVGSAIVANGRLVAGASGNAGEIGHTKVAPGGRPCGCGELGCLEAYVGGHNLLAQMREALATGTPSLLRELAGGDPARLTAGMLEQAASRGDPAARDIYDRAAGHLALAVANQVTMLNPERLILGGGVLTYCPGLRDRVRQGVQRYASWASREDVTVVEAALGDDSGLIGAALLAHEEARA